MLDSDHKLKTKPLIRKSANKFCWHIMLHVYCKFQTLNFKCYENKGLERETDRKVDRYTLITICLHPVRHVVIHPVRQMVKDSDI